MYDSCLPDSAGTLINAINHDEQEEQQLGN